MRRTIETELSGNRIAVATPTSGPHRLTIWVPTESTYLNLGQKAGSLLERGIDGFTDTHIHFWTTHTEVMMGQDCKILAGHVGYSMVTRENAYHHADKQNAFISKTNQVAIRTASAGHAVLQSDAGTTEVMGYAGVTVTAKNSVYISAGSYSPQKTTYDQAWTPVSRDGGITAAVSSAATWAYIGQVAGVTLAGFHSSVMQCKNGDSGWIPELSQAAVKTGLAIANIAACVAGMQDSPKAVRMTGGLGIGFAGMKTVMFGQILSCLTSVGGSSAVGTTAELKGWLMASVWGGVTATLGSQKVTKIHSPFGRVLIDATTTASCASDKEMLICGGKNASMRSDGFATLYGGHKVYMGSGGGYGLLVDGKSAAFGKVTNAKDLGHATIDEDYAVKVVAGKGSPGMVTANFGTKSKLRVGHKENVWLKADPKHYVWVSKKGVLVKGKEIHIE